MTQEELTQLYHWLVFGFNQMHVPPFCYMGRTISQSLFMPSSGCVIAVHWDRDGAIQVEIEMLHKCSADCHSKCDIETDEFFMCRDLYKDRANPPEKRKSVVVQEVIDAWEARYLPVAEKQKPPVELNVPVLKGWQHLWPRVT